MVPSSHTVGPLRAAKIFVTDLEELGVLEDVHTLKITLYDALLFPAKNRKVNSDARYRYGSLAATGKGHMTPQALMMGFEGSDAETIDTSAVGSRYQAILDNQILMLNGTHRIKYDMERNMVWRFDQVLPTHPNGMRFSVFDRNGDLLATNEYYSVGGGFGMSTVSYTSPLNNYCYNYSGERKYTRYAQQQIAIGLQCPLCNYFFQLMRTSSTRASTRIELISDVSP